MKRIREKLTKQAVFLCPKCNGNSLAYDSWRKIYTCLTKECLIQFTEAEGKGIFVKECDD